MSRGVQQLTGGTSLRQRGCFFMRTISFDSFPQSAIFFMSCPPHRAPAGGTHLLDSLLGHSGLFLKLWVVTIAVRALCTSAKTIGYNWVCQRRGGAHLPQPISVSARIADFTVCVWHCIARPMPRITLLAPFPHTLLSSLHANVCLCTVCLCTVMPATALSLQSLVTTPP